MIRFGAIRVHSAPETLARKVIEMIGSGELAAGDRLPSQRELARAFEVGLGSVREAIKILDVMGYLQVVPGKGTFVSDAGPIKDDNASPLEKIMEAVSLAELMEARAVVECGAAGMAAENADEEDIRRLRAVASRMDRGYTDKEAYYRDDREFHLALAEASGNPAISEIVKLLVAKSIHHRDFMNETLGISMPVNSERCLGTAREVVAFVEQGNVRKSVEAMRAHLDVVNVELKNGFFTKWSKPSDAEARRRRFVNGRGRGE